MKAKIKDLEYYMSLPYPIVVTPPVEEGEDWGAHVPDLPGCTTQAPTRCAAVEQIDEARQLWIETALEDGVTIPEPQV